MRQRHPLFAAVMVLSALSAGLPAVRAQEAEPAAPAPAGSPAEAPAEAAADPGIPSLPRQNLPLAPAVKGERPKSDPSVLPPASTTLPAGQGDLAAPDPLALPVKPSEVRIRELRPLALQEVETIVEVNNPTLKALARQVEQAQAELRAQIALWYPSIDFNASSFPSYSAGEQGGSRIVEEQVPVTGPGGVPTGETETRRRSAEIPPTRNSIWRMQAALETSWFLINPSRTPQIAAARDAFEQAKNEYLIGLRDLRLQANQSYFDLQSADDQVRIGQESVRASLISLRDAKARFAAGVATKLEVLEAETQLARDQQLLTAATARQATARRTLAALLDLPQNVTPVARDPSRVVGSWLPSLQESIVAAYAFREELDNILLDISIANSSANAELAQVQPFLRIFHNFGFGRSYGYQGLPYTQPELAEERWDVDNTFGVGVSWNLFDGGRARARYRAQKKAAEASTFRFAQQRDSIRQQVEESFYLLEQNLRNISTTSREVISTRESLRLARLRFQAGVTTQREVVDTQRDLTQAEVRYANAISEYNIRLAELRRRTGLDQIALCTPASLPAEKPLVEGATDVPVEPQPLQPACSSGSRPLDVRQAPGS